MSLFSNDSLAGYGTAFSPRKQTKHRDGKNHYDGFEQVTVLQHLFLDCKPPLYLPISVTDRHKSHTMQESGTVSSRNNAIHPKSDLLERRRFVAFLRKLWGANLRAEYELE
jgi:hypothetical protein